MRNVFKPNNKDTRKVWDVFKSNNKDTRKVWDVFKPNNKDTRQVWNVFKPNNKDTRKVWNVFKPNNEDTRKTSLANLFLIYPLLTLNKSVFTTDWWMSNLSPPTIWICMLLLLKCLEMLNMFLQSFSNNSLTTISYIFSEVKL